MGKRVAVIGASGFVGSALVEAAFDDQRFEVVPVIHSSGNAWRLVRQGLEIRMADLLNKHSVVAALKGCSHVVNCSRGNDEVMRKGLRNLIDVAGEMRMQGFVHLSSVAVYGDPPSRDSTTENGATAPRRGSYGAIKLLQDQMVQQAAKSGLPGLILCPPNISGPYSYFLSSLVSSLRAGSLALLDEGHAVCNIVDVANLVEAISLGLDHCSAQSPRLFVTDDEDIEWKGLVDALLPLCGKVPATPGIEREELARLRAELTAKPIAGIFPSLKHLVSSDVRDALRRDPLWARLDILMRKAVARMGTGIENRMRLAVEGPVRIAKVSTAARLNVPLSTQQLRGVRHSCANAKAKIGYRPKYSFAQSMEAYRAWYRSLTGQNSSYWSLAEFLW